MDRNDDLGFSLEDILQEFGEAPEEETVTTWKPAKAVHTEPALGGDTIRLDQIQQAVSEAPAVSMDKTAVFGALDVPEEPEEEELPPEPQPEPEVEPFSEEWEPEYDEPMGDYPIPEPIVFRPRSRLKELRQKLVNGPERRYYTLTEKGVGKLQMAALLCFVIFAVTALTTALFAFGLVPENRMRLVIFLQLLAMLLSALLGCYRLTAGLGSLLRLRFTPDTLLAVTFAVCCVDGVLCLRELRLPCCAAFSLEMTMSLWAEYQKRSTEIGEMDTMRRATTLDSVARVPDLYEGRPGYRTGKGEVEDFMDQCDVPSAPERVLGWYALAGLLVSLAVGVLGYARHGLSFGIQVCAAALLVCMPATAFITLSRPKAILEKRLHKLGAVLCGWKGIRAVNRNAVYPLDDRDLFPVGAAKLNGVKFYGKRDPDQVVAYAAALIQANGGALAPVFRQLLDSRGGRVYTAGNQNRYGGGGIGGEVNGEAVLVGTLEFMHDMGVEMGPGTKVSQAVYAAIDGELCGVFAVNYGRSKSSAAGLRTLCGCRGLTPVVIAEDFMITESFLRGRFGVNTRRMAFPSGPVRQEIALHEPGEEADVVALTTKEGLAPKAYALTGAWVLRGAMKAGVAIHMAGGILGLLIMAALAYIGAAGLLTPANLLLYELVWMLPGLLVTEWTRVV